jgi:hypothetical protein
MIQVKAIPGNQIAERSYDYLGLLNFPQPKTGDLKNLL